MKKKWIYEQGQWRFGECNNKLISPKGGQYFQKLSMWAGQPSSVHFYLASGQEAPTRNFYENYISPSRWNKAYEAYLKDKT